MKPSITIITRLLPIAKSSSTNVSSNSLLNATVEKSAVKCYKARLGTKSSNFKLISTMTNVSANKKLKRTLLQTLALLEDSLALILSRIKAYLISIQP